MVPGNLFLLVYFEVSRRLGGVDGGLGGRRGPRETSFYFVRVMAVESGLCISPGALPGPDLLRAIPGVL